MLKDHTISVGVLQANCHLVWDDETGQGLIIDPGDEAGTILLAVSELGFVPLGVLLTHAHVDHIRGVPGVFERYPVPVVLDAEDRHLYFSPANSLAPWVTAADGLPDPVTEAELPKALAPRILRTPGHSRGSRCYHFPEAGIVFTGDTLFKASVGRTDLPGGDQKALYQSIHSQLWKLPDHTTVYPGHGGNTSIGEERRSNPFLLWGNE